MKISPKRFLLATGTSALVALTGLAGCHTGDRTAGRYYDDHMIAHHVKGALNDAPDYKFPDVKVDTYDGIVQLNGFADKAEQKTAAGTIAARIEGVRQVQNNITIKPQGTLPAPTGSPTGQRIYDSGNLPPAPATQPNSNPGANANPTPGVSANPDPDVKVTPPANPSPAKPDQP